MTASKREILLSQRFLPEIGGSIRWFYEVFTRWQSPVEVICHDYSPDRCGEQGEPLLLRRRDAADLRICRAVVLQDDWGFDQWRNFHKALRMIALCLFRARGAKRLYCARIVPEGIAAVMAKYLLPGQRRCVAFVHGEEILACQSSRQLEFLLRHVIARLDLLIVNSHSTATLLKGYAKPSQIEVLSPGVDTTTFTPVSADVRQDLREQFHLADTAFVLLTLGRLETRKNHLAVIKSLAALSLDTPLTYLVAGEGSTRAMLEECAEAEGFVVTDGDSAKDLASAKTNVKTASAANSVEVRFLGTVDDDTRIALCQLADVFIMPSIQTDSDTEGFGIVFLEAAACGLPSIAGNVGGQAEAVRDGETGVVLDGGKPKEIAEALQFFHDSAEQRARFGVSARRFAEQYDWQVHTERLRAVLEKRGL